MSKQESTMSRGASAADKANHRLDECGRGSWWLGTLKDTPLPGLYPIRDFIEESELNPVQRTYGFKGVGRRGRILHEQRRDLLLPGAYNHVDFTQEALKGNATYSFKNCPRPENVTLGIRDKDLNTSPCDYDVAAKPVEKVPCKHVMFRSTVQRVTFPPKAGPSPCEYSPETSPGTTITSSFKSTVPRLHYVHPNTPGPGAYEPCWKLGDRVNTNMDPSFSFFFRNLP
ncbi:protein STPG4 [Periophthalmus magnuspinnatus]|uniref:protein STPG4 n=1 Tax=Periophthalmus magnuspinnatus TaxID=409849 RepID=UPI002436AAD1|nr:protein STPG4 [Periophthalmus magnuspinnatus]